MKIIHNTTSKYVPNQLFAERISNDDDCDSYIKQNKKTQLMKSNQKQKIKQTILFNDITNNFTKIKDHVNKYDLNKQQNQQNQSLEKISSNQSENCNSDSSETAVATQNKEKKQNNKKRISPKKNALIKLIMQDFSDYADEEQKEDKMKQIQLDHNQNQFFQKDEQLKNQIQYIPNKKINFLYNDINFDSSQEQNMKDEDKQSQAQTDEEIYYESTNHKNIFLDDKQFSDSCEEEDNQNSQQKSINKSKYIKYDNIDQRQKQFTYITTSQFRKSYVKENQEYLKIPIPQNKYIQFILKRDKSKRKTDHLEYYLYDSKIIKQVLYIRKINKYQIYAKQNVQNPKAHPDLKYLTAKVEANFLGNNFSLKYVNKKTAQETLAQTVSYEMNLLGLNGPRKINIYIPEDVKQKVSHNQNLESLYHDEKKSNNISRFMNKQAKWNHEVQSYVLSMKGKAKVSSVKNFLIVKYKPEDIKENKQQTQILQDSSHVIFGKIDRDRFNLVIAAPFSILQGLAIALSTFDRKFACE